MFDEAAADRAVAELAATTDGQLIVDALAGLDEVFLAWRNWRANPAYPSTGHGLRSLHDNLARKIAEARMALEKLPPDCTVRDVAKVAAPILGADVPNKPKQIAAVDGAVERLRWLAVRRPALVDEARRLAGPA